MKTEDQILKIKAVVLYILEKVGIGIDYIHLFKIMYFAQQKHLVTYGLPLMDDSFRARRHGPVPTITYKVVRKAEGKPVDNMHGLEDFCHSINVSIVDGHQVVGLNDGIHWDINELSVSNTTVLDKCIEQYSGMNSFELSKLSHDNAWRKADKETIRTGEDTTLKLVDIAKAGGAPQHTLDIIRERLENTRLLVV